MCKKNKYILYGAGHFGRLALPLFGKENVVYFVVSKVSENNELEGIPVRAYSTVKSQLKTGNNDTKIILCVEDGSNADKEISAQLKNDGISFIKFSDIGPLLIKQQISERPDYIGKYSSAIDWVKDHSIDGEGIIVSTGNPVSYPEVTGYFIPSLLRWGYTDIATAYARWLIDIQHNDGSWYDPDNTAPYDFDSGQILKGLIAIRNAVIKENTRFDYSLERLDEAIKKGCDWILSNMTDKGQLTTPSTDDWGENEDCNDLIHLYCLSPIREAGLIYNNQEYLAKVDKILNYYTTERRDEIFSFNMLSHFWSYVIEALIDLGRSDLAVEAMKVSETLQENNGFVPAYKNVHWVCTTGLFQQALIWYKLGNVKQGNKAFEYALSLQNNDGGWYGSYPNDKYPEEYNTYFAYDENSWVIKYFLDALYWKNKAEFDIQAPEFKIHYDKNDGRYQAVLNEVNKIADVSEGIIKIMDAGCGKGAYLKNLAIAVNNVELYGMDISDKVMEFIEDDIIHTVEGSLCSIPFRADYFDVTYTCEALEHAIDIDSAIKELCRVTRPDGTVIVVDKNKDKLGEMVIGDWEQWFDEDELAKTLGRYCSDVKIVKNLSYEKSADGLFDAWIGKVK